MGAACCTHPLDLIKVHLQTSSSSDGQKRGIAGAVAKVYRSDGVKGFYSGLTASLLRQASYSTTRFAIYDVSYKYLYYHLRLKMMIGTVHSLFTLVLKKLHFDTS